MTAMGPSPFCSSGWSIMCTSIGHKKAAVFPEPEKKKRVKSWSVVGAMVTVVMVVVYEDGAESGDDGNDDGDGGGDDGPVRVGGDDGDRW